MEIQQTKHIHINHLHNTMDARLWAKEFIRLKKKHRLVINEGLMIGWFANAIMAGYDIGCKRGKKEKK